MVNKITMKEIAVFSLTVVVSTVALTYNPLTSWAYKSASSGEQAQKIAPPALSYQLIR